MDIYEFGRLRFGQRVVMLRSMVFGTISLVNMEGIEVQWDDGVQSYYKAEDAGLLMRDKPQLPDGERR